MRSPDTATKERLQQDPAQPNMYNIYIAEEKIFSNQNLLSRKLFLKNESEIKTFPISKIWEN